VIIAFAIFLFIRLLSNLRRKKEETPLPPPVPSNEEKLLSEIRDLLKKQ
jgi:large conductance mechanosensitive channel